MLRGAEVKDQPEGESAPAVAAPADVRQGPAIAASQAVGISGALTPSPSIPVQESWPRLFKVMLLLALPIMAEHFLHIGVGLTDTFLANNLRPTAGLTGEALAAARSTNAAAAAAMGSTTYVLWFLGLMAGAVGTGSTALIARATGAGDRRTARSAVGQSILMGFLTGSFMSVILLTSSDRISHIFGFEDPRVEQYIADYLWILAWGLPLVTITFLGNACLRGAGDTLTPAIAMIVIDLVNIWLACSLCYGWWPFPELGFIGIAWGTAIAYGGGAFVVLGVLATGIGRSHLRLYWHRLRPAWGTIRRILRIGIPSGAEGLIFWGANFVVLYIVNTLGEVEAAAHNIAIRVESLSYMTGFAVATAAATMVGQSLGAKNPQRAKRAGYVAFALGGGFMLLAGLLFIVANEPLARLINDDPAVARTTARVLFIVGFAQVPFAAMMIFGGALRGAGDTTSVMLRNLGSALLVRMLGAVVAVEVLGYGLTAVWVVLSIDLVVRGGLLMGRFMSGKWTAIKV
jgi:putative MATE family efflux protein